jgi:hypothetical protein
MEVADFCESWNESNIIAVLPMLYKFLDDLNSTVSVPTAFLLTVYTHSVTCSPNFVTFVFGMPPPNIALLRFSGLWRCVILHVTNVSKVHTTAITYLYTEDGTYANFDDHLQEFTASQPRKPRFHLLAVRTWNLSWSYYHYYYYGLLLFLYLTQFCFHRFYCFLYYVCVSSCADSVIGRCSCWVST